MDIADHDNDVGKVVRRVRDWLNANREVGSAMLPGAAAIKADHDAYLRIVPDIIEQLRLDPHDELPHSDFLHVVEAALPLIEQARNR